MKLTSTVRPLARVLLGLVALILGVVPAPNAAAEETVDWQPIGLEEALQKAGKDKTLVMVDVYATWCGPCHKLDKETFPDAKVREVTRPFVAFRIDGETPDGEALRERFNVVGFPTVLFIAPDGNEIDRVFGFVDAPTFATMASGYARGEGTLEAQEEALAERPDDVELLVEVTTRHIVRGNETKGLELAERMRELRPDDAELHAQMHYTIGRYLYLRGRKDYELALTYFQELERQWPNSPWTARSDYDHAVALYKAGNEDKAIVRMEAFVDNAESDRKAGAYNTAAWFSFKNDARPEWGIEMAKRGLESDPDNAGLLDTLAELQYATGDKEGAIASIKRALELDNDAYYQTQLEKFGGK